MSRRITDVPPRDMPHSAHPEPPMWNRGMATRLTTSSSISKASPAAFSSMWWMLSFPSITPLGSPVVPDVYSCRAMSSTAPSYPVSRGARSAIQSSKPTLRARSEAPPRSASVLGSPSTTTRRTDGSPLAMPARQGRNSGCTTSTSARASSMTAAISAGARRQLTATFTAPARDPPNSTSK